MKLKINVAILSALILTGSNTVFARTFDIGGGSTSGGTTTGGTTTGSSTTVSEPPSALNDSTTVVPNNLPSISGNVTDNDVNGISATLTSPLASEYGFIIFNSDGSYTYTVYESSPAVLALLAGQVVVDSFNYVYSNADGQSSAATLNVQIIGNPVDGEGNTLFEQPANLPFDNVDVEPNNTSREATPLNSGLSMKGHLHDSGDKDWFVISSAGNEIITLDLCPPGSSCADKSGWVLYVFDSELFTPEMEQRTVPFLRWLDATGTVSDPFGVLRIDNPIIDESNHMYLAYRTGIFGDALIGIIDLCFGSSNTVDIGVDAVPRNYLIAISSPLQGSDGGCGAGSVLLQRPGFSVSGLNAEGETATYPTTEEYISVFPNNDDQYTVKVTTTGIHPLLSQEAQGRSSTFNADTGQLKIPKLRVLDSFYEANLSLQQYIEGNSDSNRIQFTLSDLDVLTVEEVADGFQATYNPENQQVLIPRVTINTGEAYSAVLQYHPATAASEAWLEVLEVALIQ